MLKKMNNNIVNFIESNIDYLDQDLRQFFLNAKYRFNDSLMLNLLEVLKEADIYIDYLLIFRGYDTFITAEDYTEQFSSLFQDKEYYVLKDVNVYTVETLLRKFLFKDDTNAMIQVDYPDTFEKVDYSSVHLYLDNENESVPAELDLNIHTVEGLIRISLSFYDFDNLKDNLYLHIPGLGVGYNKQQLLTYVETYVEDFIDRLNKYVESIKRVSQ